jgi:hypothetical protein
MVKALSNIPALIKKLLVLNPDAVLLDDMDSAVIGLASVGVFGPIAVYSKRKIYENLRECGVAQLDLDECYAGRFLSTWGGEHTPAILDDLSSE